MPTMLQPISASPMERRESVDALRGIAALYVLLYHLRAFRNRTLGSRRESSLLYLREMEFIQNNRYNNSLNIIVQKVSNLVPDLL
jgi:hypothetical protein